MKIKKPSDKKAYFFLLDGILAIIILFTGFVLISSASPAKPELLLNKHISRDIGNIFASTNLNDVDADCGSPTTNFDKIFCNGGAVNKENTILELIGEMHKRGSINLLGGIPKAELKGDLDTHISSDMDCSVSCLGDEASKYLLNELTITKKLINTDVFGIAFILEDHGLKKIIFNSENDQQYDLQNNMNQFYKEVQLKRSDVLILSKKMILGYWEDGITRQITFWGPYTVEIWVWNKR